jgi:hypothetical protein
MEKGWHILWPFGIYYGHLVYCLAIWYIVWPFGILFGHLVYCLAIWYIVWPFGNLVAIWYIFPVVVNFVKKNLATLATSPPPQLPCANSSICQKNPLKLHRRPKIYFKIFAKFCEKNSAPEMRRGDEKKIVRGKSYKLNE